MTQPERVSTCEGKHYLSLFLVQNGKKRVIDRDASKIATSGPLKNSRSVSLELIVDKSFSFPALFTLVSNVVPGKNEASSNNSGDHPKELVTNVSKFVLTVWSTDHYSKIKKF